MKHKIDDDNDDSDNQDGKRIKQSKSTKDEILLIKQKLKEEVEVLPALEQFNDILSSPGERLNYTEQYLSLTPDCKDLLTPLVLSKSAPKNIELVWNIIEKILTVLLERDETSETAKFSPQVIISNILQNHVDILYFSFHKIPKMNIRTSVLNCLALMLSHGVQAVRELQKHFHFPVCFKQLKECAKVTKKGAAQAEDTRSSLVRFYLAFLVFGDVACIKKLLEEKDCSDLLMAELHLDRVENVMIVLETIEEKIINEANLLRTTKLSFFTQPSLLKLTFLMKHNDEGIKTQASKILTTLCTDQRFGLCFPTKGDIFQGKLVNPVLLKFVVSVKHSAMSREDILDLSIETLNACPDIIVPYMSGLSLNLDPRQADMWCSKTTFLIKLWEGIKMANEILSKYKDQSIALPLVHRDFIMKLTIPHHLTRQLFTQGMKNKVNRVKQATLQLLELSLNRCIALKSILQGSVECPGELTQWVDAMMNILPDVTPVIGIRQMTAMSFDKKMKANSSNINEEEGEVTEDMLEENEDERPVFDHLEMDIMLSISMKCLHMYQALKPGVLTLSGFNVSKLLSFSRQVSRDIMIQSLDILLNESGAGSWVKKKISGAKNNIFDVLLKVMLTWKGDDEIISKSRRLFVKVLNGMGQFDDEMFEVDSWVASFVTVADPSSLNLFAQSCVKTVNEPFAYLENISKLFKDHQLIEDTDADFKLPSPLFFVMLRNKLVPPETIKWTIVPVLKELLVTHRNPRLLVKVILEEVCENVENYKDVMSFSYQWMKGLGLEPTVVSLPDESDFTSSPKEKNAELSCINTIASHLVQLRETKGGDKTKSLLSETSQLKEEFDSFCSDCPETSVKAVNVFIINVIRVLYCSRDILSPCDELELVFNMILSSLRILLKKHDTIMGRQQSFLELFNLTMLKSTDVEEAVWRRFSQNIHLVFLKESEGREFRSSEVLKSFVCNLVVMMGDDSRTKSSEAVQVLCEAGSLLDDSFFQETALSISRSATDGLQKIYYSDYLTVLQSLKTCSKTIDRGFNSMSFVFNNSTSTFLHAAINGEDAVMIELFLTIVSLCHCKGFFLVSQTDYLHLLTLKGRCFMDFALWMSSHNISVVEDLQTGAKPISCNEKILEDIEIGKITSDYAIVNLCPLITQIIHLNKASDDQNLIVLKLKTVLWDTLLQKLDGSNSNSTAPLLRLFLSSTTSEENLKCLEKLQDLLTDDLCSMEVVLECCVKSLTALDDEKEVKICLIDIISVLMETLTNDVTGNRYTISIEYLRKLVSMMGKMKAKMKSSRFRSLSGSWIKFVKIVLKHKYGDNLSMSALFDCVAIFYKSKPFIKSCSLTMEELFDFIVSHSKFLKVLLSESTEKRDIKITLIRTISLLAEYSGMYKPSLVPLLLMCYEGTLSEKDTLVVSFLQQYEKQGVSLAKFYPFVWGSRAYEVYKGMDLKTSLFKERSSAQVLECVDKVKMLKSATNLPIHMTFEYRGDLKMYEDNYDPFFFLPLFVNVLQPEYVVDCPHFLESGCLSMVLAVLASQDTVLRKLGYCAISLFNDHLQLTRFREKNCLTYLFMLLKNSVIEENLRFPSVWTSFLGQYLHYILKPDHHLYTVLSNLILMKPVINVKELPVFLSLFNSSNMEHTVEQSWLLKLLGDGLKDVSDYYLYKKHHVFELVMAFYGSQVCDQSMKTLIHSMLQSACTINVAAFDLVKTHSILLWIHRHLNVETNESLLSAFRYLAYVIVKTFRDGVVEDKSQVLPKLMANELLIICEQSLQNMNSLSQDNRWHMISVFMYLHSIPNYLGMTNFWVGNTDIETCFDCSVNLLADIGNDAEKSEGICCFLRELVHILQEKGDTTTMGRLNWKELFRISRESKVTDAVELCDNLICWLKKTNNLDVLENHCIPY